MGPIFYFKLFILGCFTFFYQHHLSAADLIINPYLQNLTTNSVKIYFEESSCKHRLHFFSEKEKNLIFKKESILVKRTAPNSTLCVFILDNLQVNTNYYYEIENGVEGGFFKTLNDQRENFSFIVASDAQSGYKITTRNARESILPHVKNFFKYSSDVKDYPRFFLFAGDLVGHGSKYELWKKQFFDPLEPIMKMIPVIPSIGNHEENHEYYFDYFDLPKNGSPDYLEHWYYFDYANVRFIALDTNKLYHLDLQLEWLQEVLKSTPTKGKDKIDFVIAFFHHPFKSELWVKGNTLYSGKIQKILEDFSEKSFIPSFTLFGHTHGYSLGHSYQSPHTMVNVGSVGGGLDHWGEFEQIDYLEYVKSIDEFGWNWFFVTAGENPKIEMKRFSFGHENNLKDKGVIDQILIKRYNKLPEDVEILLFNKMISEKNDEYLFDIHLSEFKDLDKDQHLSTHLQLSSNPHFILNEDQQDNQFLQNFYFNRENLFYGIDQNKGIDLTKFRIKIKAENLNGYREIYLHVRYRDTSLGYSKVATLKLQL